MKEKPQLSMNTKLIILKNILRIIKANTFILIGKHEQYDIGRKVCNIMMSRNIEYKALTSIAVEGGAD